MTLLPSLFAPHTLQLHTRTSLANAHFVSPLLFLVHDTTDFTLATCIASQRRTRRIGFCESDVAGTSRPKSRGMVGSLDRSGIGRIGRTVVEPHPGGWTGAQPCVTAGYRDLEGMATRLRVIEKMCVSMIIGVTTKPVNRLDELRGRHRAALSGSILRFKFGVRRWRTDDQGS